ncbi:hypothetical protein KKF91_06960 [Myxococcota bacterium]|nr:hypothetical protein [Myxococcota bacterium]MBU1430295.1 hypothetical protein [Myxococcota bacterium]MBU1896259.1 hypothetical protein [Myxococcota bacterium]
MWALLLLLACPPSAQLKLADGVEALREDDEAALDRAEAALNAALEACPDHPQALHGAALVQIRRGALPEAERLLRRAAAKPEAAARVHRDLGEVFLARGNLFWAMRALNAAVQRDPQDGRAQYLLGVALTRAKDKAGAAAAFEAAIAQAPGLAPLIEARRAAEALRGGAILDARDRLEALDIDALPSGLRAREYLEAAWRASGRVGLSAVLSAGVQHDNNALQVADPEAGRGASSWGGLIRGQVSYAPFSTGRLTLASRLDLSRTHHLKEAVSAYNYSAVGVGLGPQLDLAAWRQQIALRYRFHLGFLDGGPLTRPPQAHVFSESHGGALEWRFSIDPDWPTLARVGVHARRFVELRRDHLAIEGSLSQGAFFLERQLKLQLTLAGRDEDATGRGYDLYGVEERLEVSARLPLDLQLYLAARLEQRRHPDSGGYAGWEVGREDDRLTLQGALSYPLSDAWGLSLAYRWGDRASTVARFDHERRLLSLTLTAQLGDRS